jgi:hypothetical protein
MYFNRGLQNRKLAQSKFTSVFKNNLFHGSESKSGAGSTLEITHEITARLPNLLREYKIYSLLDLPCGDFNWMQKVDLGQTSYMGADIVLPLIKELQTNYSSAAQDFIYLNIINDVPPRVDLIFCRDLFVHLNTKQIRVALSNIKASGSTYLLTTSFEDARIYNNLPLISRGVGWRPICFTNEPFNFPKPLQIINEKCTEGDGKFADKNLSLWKISDLPL